MSREKKNCFKTQVPLVAQFCSVLSTDTNTEYFSEGMVIELTGCCDGRGKFFYIFMLKLSSQSVMLLYMKILFSGTIVAHSKCYRGTVQNTLTFISLVCVSCQGYCQCCLLIQPPH